MGNAPHRCNPLNDAIASGDDQMAQRTLADVQADMQEAEKEVEACKKTLSDTAKLKRDAETRISQLKDEMIDLLTKKPAK